MKNIVAFLRLIRWFHLLLAILPFMGLYLVMNSLQIKLGVECSVSGFDFALICFSVQLLIATGCVLNDIMDVRIDEINNKKQRVIGKQLTLKTAKIIFVGLTILLVIMSTYIGVYVFREWIAISASVYMLSVLYDVYFKRTPLIGNIVMALLTSFIPIVLLFFAYDCIQSLNYDKLDILIHLYIFFPFFIIIARELSLDISDIKGDSLEDCKTLPILIGAKASKIVVLAFLFLIIILSIPICYYFNYLLVWFILIDAFLIIYSGLLMRAHLRIEFIRIGRFLWFVMIFGLIGFTIATIY